MKKNNFAFVLLLSASLLAIILYSCSLPLPIRHGGRRNIPYDEDDEGDDFEDEDV
jgi:hypothetical protein